jgi:hypothetical protein
VSEGEGRHPGWVLEHPARATRWVRAATILILPKEADVPIYLGGGRKVDRRPIQERQMRPVQKINSYESEQSETLIPFSLSSFSHITLLHYPSKAKPRHPHQTPQMPSQHLIIPNILLTFALLQFQLQLHHPQTRFNHHARFCPCADSAG